MVKNVILSPAAIIPVLIPPTASRVSKAEIIAIVDPMSDAKLVIFFGHQYARNGRYLLCKIHQQQYQSHFHYRLSGFYVCESRSRMVKIDFETIIHIESYSDYIKIHLNHETIVTRETITAIEAKLPRQKFLRIHRSYIIALKHIVSFTNEEVIIKNTSLTISRSYKKEVIGILEKF